MDANSWPRSRLLCRLLILGNSQLQCGNLGILRCNHFEGGSQVCLLTSQRSFSFFGATLELGDFTVTGAQIGVLCEERGF